MGDVPNPLASGVEGTQSVGSVLVPSSIAPPMQAASVPDAIDGLLATHSRNLGGDVSARLIAASMRETSNQLAAAHQTIAEKDSEIKLAYSTITDLKVQTAKLDTKSDEESHRSRVKQICTFVGTALLGLAIDLYRNNLYAIAILVSLLGVVLLAFVAIPQRGGESRE